MLNLLFISIQALCLHSKNKLFRQRKSEESTATQRVRLLKHQILFSCYLYSKKYVYYLEDKRKILRFKSSLLKVSAAICCCVSNSVPKYHGILQQTVWAFNITKPATGKGLTAYISYLWTYDLYGPYVMLLMRADTLRGQMREGWAL